MLTALRLRICPRLLVTQWASYVMRAKSWRDAGQLGVGFVDVPEWVPAAFGIIDNEADKALKFKMENEKK